MDPSQVNIPPMKDLTTENITENVIQINSLCEDARMKYVLERLVHHLHDFARETRLSSNEWITGLNFLKEVGQISSDVRQSTRSTTRSPRDPLRVPSSGPFHTHEAEEMIQGDLMSNDTKGEPLLVVCTLKDMNGKPIQDVKVDIWETDSSGHYDVQHPDRDGPDGRCIMRSDSNGVFWFKAITPVPYPIPHDGPVGQLLKKLRRHPYRPAHMHFMFEKSGYDHLITALYIRNDPYETSDAVFGVKDSLVVDVGKASAEVSRKYGVPEGHAILTYDFVLMTIAETSYLRDQKSREAMDNLGYKVKIVDGLPIPDVD
ncbi:hypothetical protein N7497_005091 [Penicillium chrysogenum]|nr:hypothetical protein N7497_005091 [Penicillium chrysogenum]